MKNVRVQFLQVHTHNGVEYPVGAAIEVPQDIADWLVAQEVAVLAPLPAAAAPTPTIVPPATKAPAASAAPAGGSAAAAKVQ